MKKYILILFSIISFWSCKETENESIDITYRTELPANGMKDNYLPSAIRWRASKEIRKTTIIIIKGFVPATSFLPISLLPVSTRKIYVTVSRHRYLHYALSIIFNW